MRIGTIYYDWSGDVLVGGKELILYGKDNIKINNNNKNCTLSTNDKNFNIKNTNNYKEITIPYGTDLTNLGTDLTNLETRLTTLESGSGSGSNNLITFRQSIIDNVVMANPYGKLYDKITDNQKYPTIIKTFVGEEVFPKTTNTMLTAYFTSYIKTNISLIIAKELFRYYSSDDTYAAIIILVASSPPTPYVQIITPLNDVYKQYKILSTTSKVVIDLTADLAEARPNEEIVSAQFRYSDFKGDINNFYKHCVNILSNVFISYTYED
jgi:hypothetical protein